MERRGLAPRPGRLDRDDHDAACLHLMVEDGAGALLATARLRLYRDGRGLAASYAARTYDLARLMRCPGPLVEIGRFCAAEGAAEAAAVRAAWGLVAALVEAEGVRLLFGCSSFEGADPAPHRPALAHLGRHHLAPPDRAPRARAPETVDLAREARPEAGPIDRLAAMRAMPPLLRSYLAMGGWVGPEAVIDRDLDTIHVLTAVEIDRVPAARARALRALAPTG